MNYNGKLTKEQCKELGRELGNYLTGKTEMKEERRHNRDKRNNW